MEKCLPKTAIDGDLKRQTLVLIIGRDKDNRLLLQTLLQLWGYLTMEAQTILESENISNFFPPDLILLDTELLFDKALEDLFYIRQNKLFSTLPVFVISGHAKAEQKKIMLANGADEYLLKPIDYGVMEKTLKKFIGKSLSDRR